MTLAILTSTTKHSLTWNKLTYTNEKQSGRMTRFFVDVFIIKVRYLKGNNNPMRGSEV